MHCIGSNCLLILHLMAACVINHLVMFFGILATNVIKCFGWVLRDKTQDRQPFKLSQAMDVAKQLFEWASKEKHPVSVYLPSIWIRVLGCWKRFARRNNKEKNKNWYDLITLIEKENDNYAFTICIQKLYAPFSTKFFYCVLLMRGGNCGWKYFSQLYFLSNLNRKTTVWCYGAQIWPWTFDFFFSNIFWLTYFDFNK